MIITEGTETGQLLDSIISLTGAGAAEHSPFALDLAVKVDSFAAFGTNNAFTFVAGKFFRRKVDLHLLLREQIVFRHLAVGQHLLLILVFDFRMHAARQCLGRFFRGDADGFASTHVDKGRSHLSPVAKF